MNILTKKITGYKEMLEYVAEQRKLGYGVTFKVIQVDI